VDTLLRVLRRLGLNLLYLVPQGVGGTEIFARRLIGAIARERPGLELVCFCGREAAAVLPAPDWPANVRVERVPVTCASKPRRFLAELTLLPRLADRAGVDVLHSLGTTAPLHGRAVRVTTIHDLIYQHYPSTFPGPARRGLQVFVPLGAWRSRRIQTGSNATRDELVSMFRLPRERIDVVPHGPGMRDVPDPTPPDALRRRFELDGAPVLLTVNAGLAHKNLDRLLHALPLLDGDRAPVLVLAGRASRDSERLRALAAELGVEQRVRMTGWLDERDLEGLYGLADAFVYPSLHEGFGLPVLEAMRRGVPVACARATSLPEVAGDAAILFDPYDVEAIAEAAGRLLGDAALAAELVRRGRERAEGYSWERSARAVLDSYDRALAG
jgi:glycosyltransferase involved in cell wall biosynthesis